MALSAGVFIVYMHTNQLSIETTFMCGGFSAAELGVSSVAPRLFFFSWEIHIFKISKPFSGTEYFF